MLKNSTLYSKASWPEFHATVQDTARLTCSHTRSEDLFGRDQSYSYHKTYLPRVLHKLTEGSHDFFPPQVYQTPKFNKIRPWLLYISQWSHHSNGRPSNNIRFIFSRIFFSVCQTDILASSGMVWLGGTSAGWIPTLLPTCTAEFNSKLLSWVAITLMLMLLIPKVKMFWLRSQIQCLSL